MNFDQPIKPENNSVENKKTPEGKIKEGVDFVFEQNPELVQVGTKEQYSEYLDTVFPESKVKDIVYHGSNASFKEEGFKPTEPNFDTLNSVEGVYNFSSNLKFIKRYGENVYCVLLDIKNPIVENTTGEYVDDLDRPLSEALFKIGKQKKSNILAPKFQESLKDTDAVINKISGEEYIEKHPVSGREIGLPKQQTISVFNSEQIHILGSQKDIENFKNFVSKTEK